MNQELRIKKNKTYETIIGLEIHVELATSSKMFCRCPVPTLTDQPNTKTCPVCLGLPGALPYANKQAVESCIKIALALGCRINKHSFFERKNYFYPDLAKGFQTSQYLHPFGEKGSLDIEIGGKVKTIGITRVHMEEDTGKLTHSKIDGDDVSLIDFNRSGVPLVEIVTEPDIRSGEEAKEFLVKLQRIIRYLDVSDADMEKGHMRLEPNISLRELKTQKPNTKNELPAYKVEVKNINSFKFVDKAIKYEQKRHEEMLSDGKTPIQETRGWNEFKNKTVSQRSKEEAHDYRYFPEPDIPPIEFTDEQIKKIGSEIPELPDEKTEKFTREYKIKKYDAQILSRDKLLADYFEEAVRAGKEFGIPSEKIAAYIINRKVNIEEILPATLIKQLVKLHTYIAVDEAKLEHVIKEILEKNPDAVEEYKAGKTQVVGFLIGMVRKEIPEANDTNQIRNKLTKMLE